MGRLKGLKHSRIYSYNKKKIVLLVLISNWILFETLNCITIKSIKENGFSLIQSNEWKLSTGKLIN